MSDSTNMRKLITLMEATNNTTSEYDVFDAAKQMAAQLYNNFPEILDRTYDHVTSLKSSAVFFRAALASATFGDKNEYAEFKKNSPEFATMFKEFNTKLSAMLPGAAMKFASQISQSDRGGTTFEYELVLTIDKRKDPAYAEEIEVFKKKIPAMIKDIAAKVSPKYDTMNLGLTMEYHSVSAKGPEFAYRLEHTNYDIRSSLKDQDQWGSFDEEGAFKEIMDTLANKLKTVTVDGKPLKVYGQKDRPNKIIIRK
jgi:hypothetical protein